MLEPVICAEVLNEVPRSVEELKALTAVVVAVPEAPAAPGRSLQPAQQGCHTHKVPLLEAALGQLLIKGNRLPTTCISAAQL